MANAQRQPGRQRRDRPRSRCPTRRLIAVLGLAAVCAGVPLGGFAPAVAGESPASSAAGSPRLAALGHAHQSVLVVADRVCLEHRHIDPASIRVNLGTQQLTYGRDFLLEAQEGCLVFPDLRQFLGAELEIDYAYFPFDLEAVYAHRVPGVIPVEASPDTVVPVSRLGRPRTAGGTGGRLRVRGNKTFSVRFGTSRDATLNQSLDLDVSGEVASGVELRAILSDRDLPLQAEGNTETLNELDKVMLEVRSRNLSATLGDYDVRALGGDFLSYSKRLEGVKAEGGVGQRSFVLAAAVSRGQFISLELTGEEGKQGPYVLTDGTGNDDIVVIAGSETVWIDGLRLTRGGNNDYTIDYGRAEITFTSRRLITRDSRITVDFEYSAEAFERNFYIGGAKATLGDGRLDLGVSIVSESDDAGAPIGVLTDSERELLAEIGDSTRTTAAEAGVFAGPGAGDYLAIGDDPETRRYQYAGRGHGDYLVNFALVGPGAGDYTDSLTAGGERAYRYVGLGVGSYQPVRVLAPPSAHRLIDLAGAGKIGEALEVESELALSGLDLNTLSSVDDLDNNGSAKKLRLTYSPTVDIGGRAVGILLAGGYRDVGTRFRTLGRVRPADYSYSWNAPSTAFDRGERLRDVGIEVTPIAGFVLGTDAAATRTDTYDGDRTGFSLRLDRRLVGRFRLERADGRAWEESGADSLVAPVAADRSRDFESGELRTTIRMITPRVHYEREERVDRRLESRSGNVYTQFGGGAELSLPARARFMLDLRQRLDRVLGTGSPWADARRAFEQSYRLEVPRARSLSLSGGFTRRTADDFRAASRQVSDLIQLDVLHSSHSGGFETEGHYDVTTTDISNEGQALVFVGSGQGVYDELGRFVGTGGDYALVRTEAGGSDLRTRLRLSLRSEVRPRRFLGSPAKLQGPLRALAALGFETTVQVDELTRLNLASPRLFFDPANYQRDDATFFGTFVLRQDIDVMEGNRLLNLRLRLERRDDADNRIAGVLKDLAERNQAIRFRSSPWPKLTAELEQSWGSHIEEERVMGTTTAPNRFDLARGATALTLTGHPGGSLRLELLVRRQTDRERDGIAEARRLEVTPSFTTHLKRARIDCRFRRVDERRAGIFPASYRVGTSTGVRSEYDVGFDYRATDHVTVTAGVDGIRPPGQRFSHTARMEVRAFF